MNIAHHPLYSTWRAMKQRCQNPKSDEYHNYGGRGIRVCERWRDSFRSFLEDVGDRPSEVHTIDRWPDQNGDYGPDNFRWATPKEQTRNKRDNTIVVIEGVTYKAIDLQDRSGIKAQIIANRAQRGMTLEEVLSKERHYRHSLPEAVAAIRAKKLAQTHCKYGHEYTPENTARTKEGHRECRRCNADKARAWRERHGH